MITQYSPLKAALEKLTIFDVWQALGLKGTPRKSCRSPFRDDRHPSFAIYANGRRFHDHTTGGDGDAADFCAHARDLSREEGARLLIDLAGTRRANSAPQDNGGSASRQSPGNPKPYDPFKDQEKARKRQGWPALESPTQAEIKAIATLRGLSPEGVALAHERGLLFTADSREGRAWVITDSARMNAQARRMDGAIWERIDAKAWTLPGSVGGWPVGLREAQAFPSIALVEGGPDLLAAFHLAWCETSTPETLALGKGVDVLGNLGVVAIFGAKTHIIETALPPFAGKRVRIFAHDDCEGYGGAATWAATLKAAGATVDSFGFTGFCQSDGCPVGDLNDFTRIDPDQWEAERELIESAFAFVPANPPPP